LLHRNQRTQNDREYDAMYEGASEYHALMTLEVGDGNTGRDVLWRDHLAHDTTGRIGRGRQRYISSTQIWKDRFAPGLIALDAKIAKRQG
jgi:hypothetical protein